MNSKDAQQVISKFVAVMRNHQGRKQPLAVTFAKLEMLHYDAENLFHEDELVNDDTQRQAGNGRA